MRASSYAQALHGALLEHPEHEEKILSQFVETVGRNGHSHLFPRIVKHFARIIGKTEQETTIEVISAKEMTEGEVVALLKKEPFKLALTARHKKVIRKVDDQIIGGVIVHAGTTRIDASHKQALLQIYHNFTATL